jgi:hypothetical protein
MKFPWTSRIMACLPGHSPVELARFHRSMVPSDVHAVTADLDPAWEIYGEYQTHRRDLISDRPVLAVRPYAHGPRVHSNLELSRNA